MEIDKVNSGKLPFVFVEKIGPLSRSGVYLRKAFVETGSYAKLFFTFFSRLLVVLTVPVEK